MMMWNKEKLSTQDTPFKSLLGESRDWIILVEWSVIVTKTRNGAGSIGSRFRKQDYKLSTIQTLTKTGKAYPSVEVDYSMTMAYCALRKETNGHDHFECCPGIFRNTCVIAELFWEAAIKETQIDHDQNS